jgi:hypothetical protein
MPAWDWNTAPMPGAIIFPLLRQTRRSRVTWCNGHGIGSTKYRCQRTVTEEEAIDRLHRMASRVAVELLS